MALCEQCGSINIVRALPERSDKLVAFLTGAHPFVCRRCGWRARRDWTDEDLRRLGEYGAGGAEPDPPLAALDGDQDDQDGPGPMKVLEFDLDGLDIASNTTVGLGGRRRVPKRLKRPKRPKRSKRRARVATVAATAFVMLLVVMVGLTGSCATGIGGY